MWPEQEAVFKATAGAKFLLIDELSCFTSAQTVRQAKNTREMGAGSWGGVRVGKTGHLCRCWRPHHHHQ